MAAALGIGNTSTFPHSTKKEQPMKPFARINLSSVALRRGILVSSLALAAGCASTLKVDNAPVAALDLNRYLGEW